MRKTIRAAQFMYYLPTGEERVRKDGTKEEVLSVRHAKHGDTVDIPREQDIAAGEKARAFEPDDEVEQESPVADPSAAAGPDFSSHDSLVEWMKTERPTVDTVVAAADNDPTKAEALLAAENEASGGQSRKGVVTGLEDILLDEEEEDE